MAETTPKEARQARLSKALSAAYITHQIGQLEDRVQDVGPIAHSGYPHRDGSAKRHGRRHKDTPHGGGHNRTSADGGGSGSFGQSEQFGPSSGNGAMIPAGAGAEAHSPPILDHQFGSSPSRYRSMPLPPPHFQHHRHHHHHHYRPPPPPFPNLGHSHGYRSGPARDWNGKGMRLVVDASALVYTLPVVRGMLKRGASIVVPSDVLRTLDLLKKSSHPISVRAREATRFVEHAQHRSSHHSLDASFGLDTWGLRIQRDDELDRSFLDFHAPLASTSTTAAAKQRDDGEIPGGEATAAQGGADEGKQSIYPTNDMPAYVVSVLQCASFFRQKWNLPREEAILLVGNCDGFYDGPAGADRYNEEQAAPDNYLGRDGSFSVDHDFSHVEKYGSRVRGLEVVEWASALNIKTERVTLGPHPTQGSRGREAEVAQPTEWSALPRPLLPQIDGISGESEERKPTPHTGAQVRHHQHHQLSYPIPHAASHPAQFSPPLHPSFPPFPPFFRPPHPTRHSSRSPPPPPFWGMPPPPHWHTPPTPQREAHVPSAVDGHLPETLAPSRSEDVHHSSTGDNQPIVPRTDPGPLPPTGSTFKARVERHQARGAQPPPGHTRRAASSSLLDVQPTPVHTCNPTPGARNVPRPGSAVVIPTTSIDVLVPPVVLSPPHKPKDPPTDKIEDYQSSIAGPPGLVRSSSSGNNDLSVPSMQPGSAGRGKNSRGGMLNVSLLARKNTETPGRHTASGTRKPIHAAPVAGPRYAPDGIKLLRPDTKEAVERPIPAGISQPLDHSITRPRGSEISVVAKPVAPKIVLLKRPKE